MFSWFSRNLQKIVVENLLVGAELMNVLQHLFIWRIQQGHHLPPSQNKDKGVEVLFYDMKYCRKRYS